MQLSFIRHIILQLILCGLYSGAFAQTVVGVDTSLKFDQRPSRCEKKWVVVSKSDTAKQYLYGYIYIDLMAGFTFDLKGSFKLNVDGTYSGDTISTKNTSLKYRIAPNWRNVALLSPKHFKELNIGPTPSWLKFYYDKIDTASAFYNYRMGFNYNAIGDSEPALKYLNKANSITPHPDGVEFELIYAYNGLNQFDEVIKLILPAIERKPDNPLLYKELGYAYLHNKQYEQAISTYKKGLQYFSVGPSDEKAEMALNMAVIYRTQGNQEDYKNWMIKAKGYSIPDSNYYRQIVAAGF